jgi:hypothetical protein
MEPTQVTLTCDIDDSDELVFEVQDGELWAIVPYAEFFVRIPAEQLPPLIKLLTEFASSKGITP